MFVKLFSTILYSSIWGEPAPTKVVWITLLAMADEHGVVWATLPGIARAAAVSLDEARKAMDTIERPDPYSATPDEDGRRAVPIEGGWRLVNYEKYREMRTTAQRRTAARVRRYRERQRQQEAEDSVTCNDVTTEAEAEAEVDTDSEAEEATGTTPPSGEFNSCGASDAWPTSYPHSEKAMDATAAAGATIGTQGVGEGWDRSPTGSAASETGTLALVHPPSDEPTGATFLCRGPGPDRWALPDRLVREWSAAFPSIDVPYQIERARRWVVANKRKRKTARGMEKFLLQWLDREEERARKAQAGAPQEAEPRGFQGLRDYLRDEGLA